MRIDNQARSASVRSRQAMIVVFLEVAPKGSVAVLAQGTSLFVGNLFTSAA
jgi:hypothetical protein